MRTRCLVNLGTPGEVGLPGKVTILDKQGTSAETRDA